MTDDFAQLLADEYAHGTDYMDITLSYVREMFPPKGNDMLTLALLLAGRKPEEYETSMEQLATFLLEHNWKIGGMNLQTEVITITTTRKR